jgi:transcriptional antiterminator NusG
VEWFVLHTYAGQEQTAKRYLELAIEREGMQEKFGQILVPFRDVVQVSTAGGKRKTKTHRENLFPTYLIVEMDLDMDSQHLVLSIPGITNFVGPTGKPQAMRQEEVNSLLGIASEEQAPTVEIPFAIDDQIRIKEGPFKDFTGQIKEVMDDKQRLKAMVSVFGRETPVELAFNQVEPVYQ